MRYRREIDGLRALAVIAVIIFHSNYPVLSGGYTGVDIFFVISGYLVTGLIHSDVKKGIFRYRDFYKRRVARLLPALLITLLLVSIFGFLFYDNSSFDNLGKEIFFSSIGGANILFAQGVNYFAQDESVRPLIHLWSLGVEEQFYIVWPLILILVLSLNNRNALFFLFFLFLMSFLMSFFDAKDKPVETYFYPHYRAFELIVGAFLALLMKGGFVKKIKLNKIQNEVISCFSLVLILVPMFYLDKHSVFPGVNTLPSLLGVSLFILFSHQTVISKLFSMPVMVFLGLLSYPLYLYHQPIISYIYFFKITDNSLIVFSISLLISLPLSWFTYRYVEMPIRNKVRENGSSSTYIVFSLILILLFFSMFGLFVAKTNGFSERFKLFNSFSYLVAQNHETSFHKYFKRGIRMSPKVAGRKKILFVGDSLLQQYVYPISKALNFNLSDVDTITRGGCVLLKGVDFVDQFSDISCNDMREKLYKIDIHYDYIVFSQKWNGYDKNILNFDDYSKVNSLKRWEDFIQPTIKYFERISNNIIIIGAHPEVDGVSSLTPNIFLNKMHYREKLKGLKVSNVSYLLSSTGFFSQWKKNNLFVLNPMDIWGKDKFILYNEEWSFFRDSQHASNASNEYLEEKIRFLLSKKY